jgi:hypothetical protein
VRLAAVGFAFMSLAPLDAAGQRPTWVPVFGFHIGPPARISAVLGIGRIVSRHQPDSARRRTYWDRDVFAAIEPGWKGGRLSVGYGEQRNSTIQTSFVNGRLSLFKPWAADSVTLKLGPGLYVGGEVSGSAVADAPLGLRVGVLTLVGRAPVGTNRHRIPFDFAVGW